MPRTHTYLGDDIASLFSSKLYYTCICTYTYAKYKITVSPRPFSDQNSGLTEQTCNYSAICAHHFL